MKTVNPNGREDPELAQTALGTLEEHRGHHLTTTSAMLRALIAGESCEHIASNHGVTKSAVAAYP
jgi:hypothetical protein